RAIPRLPQPGIRPRQRTRAASFAGLEKNFPALLKAALLGCTAGTPIELWFQDEARVGQQGSLAYVWAPVGSRPAMVRDNRHSSAYLFGAICPARGVGAAVITPVANAAAMNAHLAEISNQVAPGAQAVLLMDRAGWHRCGKRLRVPTNITPLHLPPYSPELKPNGECLGIPARKQALRPGLGYLRRHRRGLRQRGGLPHQRPRAHPLHRNPGLGVCQCLGELVLAPCPSRSGSGRQG
ncbi:MAG: transposase, partial [Acetobacteraceae bacterium]|nr:transposase [Acetobacteraceae bacterium]